ncbi:hypothetical protein Moror_8710 [Moniliophthora roreri MCA 2997]|uniref:Uncharacterized protein n=1 Tax=Moniliophthora roreri (strain MCA 2997) TaxID=1381753 RepID=V2X738_MONRO|nr:hypothetical protein Moror_8710 [Moniliophthora roreri MCA 2997]
MNSNLNTNNGSGNGEFTYIDSYKDIQARTRSFRPYEEPERRDSFESFTEYRSSRVPPSKLGNSGDIFVTVAISSETTTLYVKLETRWSQWVVPKVKWQGGQVVDLERVIVHPICTNCVLWVTPRQAVDWVPRRVVRKRLERGGSKKRVFYDSSELIQSVIEVEKKAIKTGKPTISSPVKASTRPVTSSNSAQMDDFPITLFANGPANTHTTTPPNANTEQETEIIEALEAPTQHECEKREWSRKEESRRLETENEELRRQLRQLGGAKSQRSGSSCEPPPAAASSERNKSHVPVRSDAPPLLVIAVRSNKRPRSGSDTEMKGNCKKKREILNTNSDPEASDTERVADNTGAHTAVAPAIELALGAPHESPQSQQSILLTPPPSKASSTPIAPLATFTLPTPPLQLSRSTPPPIQSKSASSARMTSADVIDLTLDSDDDEIIEIDPPSGAISKNVGRRSMVDEDDDEVDELLSEGSEREDEAGGWNALAWLPPANTRNLYLGIMFFVDAGWSVCSACMRTNKQTRFAKNEPKWRLFKHFEVDHPEYNVSNWSEEVIADIRWKVERMRAGSA